MIADTTHFSKEGALFTPKIATSIDSFTGDYDAPIITLNCDLESDLNWDEALELAGEYPQIVFKLDFGWSQLAHPLTEELPFNSFRLAVTHFNEVVYPQFEGKIMGVILYEGMCDLSETFLWSEPLKEAFELEGEGDMVRFCLKALSEYLHHLAALLPIDIIPMALIDATPLRCPIQIASLFSKEMFPHVQLGIKGGQLPRFGLRWEKGATVGGFIGSGPVPNVEPEVTAQGFVLPNQIDPEVITDALKSIEGPYRLLDESLLAESWDELETLYVIESLMSTMGLRKLKAFEAAGGHVKKVSG